MNAKYAVTRGAGGVKILVEPVNPEDDVTFETQNDVALFERNKFIWVGGNKDGTGAKKVEAFKRLDRPRRVVAPIDSVVFKPGRRCHGTSTTCSGLAVPSGRDDMGERHHARQQGLAGRWRLVDAAWAHLREHLRVERRPTSSGS
jgi:hypothetical protein